MGLEGDTDVGREREKITKHKWVFCTKAHHILQEDLKSQEPWAQDWGMRFNTKQCYILSLRGRSSVVLSMTVSMHLIKIKIKGGGLIGTLVTNVSIKGKDFDLFEEEGD